MTSKDRPSESDRPCYRPVGRIVLRQVGGDALLVPVTGNAAVQNHVYPLNDTAAFIWERLAREDDYSTIVEAVSRHFDITPEEAEKDCGEFIDLLINETLVERVA